MGWGGGTDRWTDFNPKQPAKECMVSNLQHKYNTGWWCIVRGGMEGGRPGRDGQADRQMDSNIGSRVPSQS